MRQDSTVYWIYELYFWELFLWIYYLKNTLSSVSSLPGYNVSQSSIYRPLDGPKLAVDGDVNTCAVTEKSVNGYWRIQFNQTLTVKGMILRMNGGMFFYCCVFELEWNLTKFISLSLHGPFQFYRKLLCWSEKLVQWVNCCLLYTSPSPRD